MYFHSAQCSHGLMSAQLSRCVAIYSRHFVASRINTPVVVVAVVFTLDHFVTTQRTVGWTKSLLNGGIELSYDNRHTATIISANIDLSLTMGQWVHYSWCILSFTNRRLYFTVWRVLQDAL